MLIPRFSSRNQQFFSNYRDSSQYLSNQTPCHSTPLSFALTIVYSVVVDYFEAPNQLVFSVNLYFRCPKLLISKYGLCFGHFFTQITPLTLLIKDLSPSLSLIASLKFCLGFLQTIVHLFSELFPEESSLDPTRSTYDS